MLNQLRSWLERGMLPFVVSLSVMALLLGHAAGWNLEMVVLALSVGSLLVAFALEHAIPFSTDWNRARDDFNTDATSTVILLGLVDPLLKYAAPIAVVALYRSLAWPADAARWPNLPFLVNVGAALLLVEFGRYWAHRWHHASPSLWWLHALHHSSTRLYAFNNFRYHPLNYAINFCLGSLPLMLLGVPADVLLGVLALTQPVLMLQHANLNLKSGWLNWVFSSNEVHRWHHSAADHEANCNFGSALVLWDHEFGTYRAAPTADNQPQRIGLFAQSGHYPAQASYFAQLRSMFQPDCCKAA